MRELLLKIGAYGFLAAVITTLVVTTVFGYEMVVWPTIILTYPALILLGASVGLGDFVELFRYLRAGDSGRRKVLSVLFVLGRGLVFTGILVTFLSFEIRLIAEILQNS